MVPKSKLNMVRARVKVEYAGEDGTRYEMTFDVTPANPFSALYFGVEPHWEDKEVWVLGSAPEIVDHDIELQFEHVNYEGLIRTISPDEVDNP